MNGKRFNRQADRQPIAPATINDPIAEIERFTRLGTAAPLNLDDSCGPQARLDTVVPIWAKLTSGTGPYAWTEQTPTASGTWTNGFMSGTTSVDPAYNTLTATLTLPMIVDMVRAVDGSWRFSAGSC